MTTHAQTFRRLHDGPEVLLLANCWDAASARVVECFYPPEDERKAASSRKQQLLRLVHHVLRAQQRLFEAEALRRSPEAALRSTVARLPPVEARHHTHGSSAHYDRRQHV